MVLRVAGSSPVSHPEIADPGIYRGLLWQMFYVYILKSLKDNKYYYGHTAGLDARLCDHNKGKVKSTRGRRPLVIHYFETFETKSEASKREYYFKSIDGYIFLKRQKII